MREKQMPPLLRRAGAGLLAAGTLWTASVTAGSVSAGEAWASLRTALPLQLLRWELGDAACGGDLSPAAELVLGQTPALLSARGEVAAFRAQEEQETQDEEEPMPQKEEPTPPAEVAETPVDNGVSAKTLIPIDPTGYTVCGTAYISNSTDHALSVSELEKPFAAALTDTGEPQILILHTHGSEAYTPVEGNVAWSGEYRTTDSRYNVVSVGDTMAEVFGELGLSVLHDRTLYDYPAYAGAYTRSLEAVERYLAQYPSIQIVLDIHRDAVQDADGTEYRVVSPIDGVGTAAQLSMVLGSDGSGLAHPNWMENLRLAVAVQQKALAAYPTLMRPILLRNTRYNQHTAPGALLVEVGAAGNSPQEAKLAATLFARTLTEVLQENASPG